MNAVSQVNTPVMGSVVFSSMIAELFDVFRRMKLPVIPPHVEGSLVVALYPPLKVMSFGTLETKGISM